MYLPIQLGVCWCRCARGHSSYPVGSVSSHTLPPRFQVQSFCSCEPPGDARERSLHHLHPPAQGPVVQVWRCHHHQGQHQGCAGQWRVSRAGHSESPLKVHSITYTAAKVGHNTHVLNQEPQQVFFHMFLSVVTGWNMAGRRCRERAKRTFIDFRRVDLTTKPAEKKRNILKEDLWCCFLVLCIWFHALQE